MNIAMAFFSGCITFVLMMVIKIPIKKMNFWLADMLTLEKEVQYVLYKRFNLIIIFITMLVAMICYYFVLQGLGEEHFKICCSMKAGAIAIALYAAFEQWFGEV